MSQFLPPTLHAAHGQAAQMQPHKPKPVQELHPIAQAKNCAIKNYPKQLNITASYVSSRAKPAAKPKLLHKAIMLSSHAPSRTSRTVDIETDCTPKKTNTRAHFLSGGMKGTVP
jgi:hypothetical protein